MHEIIRHAVQLALDLDITHAEFFHKGVGGEVYGARLTDGRLIVVKVGETAEARLDIEGAMVRYLREFSPLPVPTILFAEPALLIMDFVHGNSQITNSVQTHAADLLAALHNITATGFGLEFDTQIGGLHQPNPQSEFWIDFFRDYRLLYMADVAYLAGALPKNLRHEIDKLAGRLEKWLLEPENPSLLHGDLWTGNILAQDGRITGFIDPAIYYGDPEIELAFTTLFGTFDDSFFERYQEHRTLEPGFFEVRRDLYNLYPLLVHVRLFGERYIPIVERTLARYR